MISSRPEVARRLRLREAGDAAVHADDELHAGLFEFQQPGAVQPVPLGEAQGDVELHVRAELAEYAEEDGRYR
jgi:hypothetical protein